MLAESGQRLAHLVVALAAAGMVGMGIGETQQNFEGGAAGTLLLQGEGPVEPVLPEEVGILPGG